METMYPAATFTATRNDILGSEPLLGAAEIARGVCCNASGSISVLAITHDRMRRIDTWSNADGFVTHAASPDPTRSIVGSVCDRERAVDLVDEIIASLVGELPEHPAASANEIPDLQRLTPAMLPTDLDWLIVISSSSAGPEGGSARVAIADSGGLSIGAVETLDRPIELAPASTELVRRRVAELVGSPPRRLRDVLLDDRPR